MGAEQCGAMSGRHDLCTGSAGPGLSVGYSEHSE